ncbi:uncharacterized protein IUM83_05139 [Phytophthora cinnamomi]|uniref:uncharacterized protein n=1 Tax=Phytophthora cinnamomi TaxID=4785 RepID=UPI00355A31F7|nr:hypothetical protein IUM83_05139 [Phytophthora cinnamomi]
MPLVQPTLGDGRVIRQVMQPLGTTRREKLVRFVLYLQLELGALNQAHEKSVMDQDQKLELSFFESDLE